MKYGFLKEAKYDSDYFLKLSIVSRHNAIVLQDSAKIVLQNQPKRRYGLLYYYTAYEELQKAIFFMLVHRGFMNKEQIFPVLTKHESKIILFDKIFSSKKGLSIDNNEFILDGTPLKELDFNQIIDENKAFGREYMDKRNDCLYVRPEIDDYHTPSIQCNLDDEITRLNDEMSALNGLYNMLWGYDFRNIDGFGYYKLTPKDKPATHNITFGGGELIERKDFRPSWVDELQKELQNQ